MKGPTLFDSIFDYELYRSKFEDNLATITTNEEVLEFWRKVDRGADYSPLPHFDREFYLEINLDVKESGVPPVQHFVNYGLHEGRSPSPYITQIVDAIIQKFALEGHFSVTELYFPETILADLSYEVVEIQCKEIIKKMFYRPYYERQLEREFTDEPTALNHYLKHGLKEGFFPTPLFNAGFYHGQIEKHLGLATFPPQQSFLHWLLIGRELNLSFMPLFDEQDYLESFLDLKRAKNCNFFEHFICYGVRENRRVIKDFDITWYLNSNKLPKDTPALLHYLTFATPETAFSPSVLSNNIPTVETNASALENYSYFIREEKLSFTTDIYQEIFRQAEAIEPSINNTLQERTFLIPTISHLSNRIYVIASKMRNLLGDRQFDYLVTIPHCRMSGAGRVAAALCTGLCRCTEPGKILLVITDGHEMLRPEWFPAGIVSLNLFELFSDDPEEVRMRALIDLVRGTSCKDIINVNSRLAWATIEKFGSQLAEISSLSSYLFCWDRNKRGKRVGYPEMYFSRTFAHLKNIFVDTHFLKNELISQFKLPLTLAEKICVLHSPVTTEPLYNFAEIKSVMGVANDHPVIFWGGRLDRQKRFDIVVAIAQQRSELEIWFWGKNVLDAKLNLNSLPKNLIYKGEYRHLSELPFLHCDLWLYTSEWDGMPTLLLDIAALGIPLVSANIEGITDLLTEENSWPVADNLNPAAYLQQIDRLLANRALAIEKAYCLQQTIKANYNTENYVQTLRSRFND